MTHSAHMRILGLTVVVLLLTSACGSATGSITTPTAEPPPVTDTPSVEPTMESGPESTTSMWATPIPWPDRTPESGSLVVDADLSLGQISPYVYGSNYGPWVIVPFDLLDEAEAAGITMLRFPGGEWGDRNNLQELQVDRFIKLARQMGSEPVISVRLRGGTPEQAAEMVRYVNVEQNYNLPYWSIGNEPNLYSDYTVEQFLIEWRAIADAMLAVDPDLKLLGPEVSQYTGGDGPGPSDAHIFLDAFLETNGDMVDVVTIHRYPLGRSMDNVYTVEDLLSTSSEWDSFIPDLHERIQRLTGRDLPVGVTELNSDWTQITSGEGNPGFLFQRTLAGRCVGAADPPACGYC
ncbi:MAG: hypothetical protein R3C44_22260 [Chloroflexota bacterium]